MIKNGRKLVLVSVICLFATSFLAGCAHMEKSPPERQTGFFYIHKPLPEASRKVEDAHIAGKDKECPAEFKAAENTVDKAYAIYLACNTQEAIAMAQDGINKLNALCPKAPKAALSPKASLSAVPASVKQNTCATLTWSTTNATRVSIDQGIGNVDSSGSKQVCPASTTRYTITVTGEGGVQTADTTVRVTPLSAKVVVFEEAALFDIDKADLKPAGKEQIKRYREEAQAELSRADKIKITGHTDNTGSADYNMKLSLRRAEAVRDYLVSLGVDAKKLEVSGEGMTMPVADNSTAEGRAKNRRVEIEVMGLEK